MTTATITNDLYERLLDRLRHAMQYAEAARLMTEDALSLLEAVKAQEQPETAEEVKNGGEPAS